MGLASRMLLVLSLAGTAAAAQHTPARRAVDRPGQPRDHFRARWIGQDGHDYAGPSFQLTPSGVQDIHIALVGLDPARQVVLVEVKEQGGDTWRYQATGPCWKAELKRGQDARTADLFFEPSRKGAGPIYHVLAKYDDGSTVAADVRGQKANPNLRTREATLAARWVGQDGQDWTGPGPSVGPDGLQDVHIHLSGLAAAVAVQAIRIEGLAGARWEQGTNPRLLSNAELVRDAKNPSQGDLYFQPDRDLSAERIKVRVAYENDKLDATTLITGRCDPALAMPVTPLPDLSVGDLKAEWLGQDGASAGAPGDVHVRLSGLPATPSIGGAVLTDAVRGTWIYKGSDRVSIPADPTALPLAIKLSSDRQSADLFFPPYRDESKETLTLRLIAANGGNLLARFPGGSCDLGRRARQPEPSRALAKPGDDLQGLVQRYGTVVLTPGTHRLGRPLVLDRPVTVTSEGGATLLFDQAPTEPRWTAAIKLHCGNTTLNGFAVRFSGPIRWNSEVYWGPAVIGTTDNLDPPHDEPKVNVAFTHLDLKIPPIENTGGWAEALRLMRLIGATNGVIAGNVLRGGPIEFFGGPWRVVDNDFRGTLPGTFSHGVFTGHGTFDLLLRGNRTRFEHGSGKTWRFLVLTSQGANDVVERNIIEGLGARVGDTIPWSNEPEIILTEAYHVRYEGKVMALAGDGRVLRIGRPQGEAVRTGDAVSLLNGPAAGQWRRIAQAIDSTTYLVDPPIPAGTELVSIAPGFIAEVFQENRIDVRGGRQSGCLCFIGNHFGTRVKSNHLLGGSCAFRMTACPTETPLIWGWSHAPFLGGVIEANIIEDAERGGSLAVEHDPRHIKTNEGRTYMTARVADNVVRWSEPFFARMAASRAESLCAGLTLGSQQSHDPGELVVRARGNRLEAPPRASLVPSLMIHAALCNSQRIVNRAFQLPREGSTPAAGRREASKRPAPSAR